MSSIPPFKAFEQPAPYRRIEGFMGDETVTRLLAHTVAREKDFQLTGVQGREGGKINPEIRISRVLRDFGDLKGEMQTRFTTVIDFAIKELGMSAIDLGRLELEIVAHGDGAFYGKHIDTMTQYPDAKSVRALTAVYYFHRLPKGFSGGELRLHSIAETEAGKNFVDIAPERDSLVLFPSWAPHEVRPISCPSGDFLDSRFAINCWYHNRRKTA